MPFGSLRVPGTLSGGMTISDIIDNLTSTATSKALSANQGKLLKGYIDNLITLVGSNNVNLDTLQEIVDYIVLNKTTLDTLSISNIAGLATALANKAASDHTHTPAQIGAYSTSQIDTLFSNLKTINNNSIIGPGNIVISGGSGSAFAAFHIHGTLFDDTADITLPAPYIVATVDDLATVPVTYNNIIVSDPLRGGTFKRTSTAEVCRYIRFSRVYVATSGSAKPVVATFGITQAEAPFTVGQSITVTAKTGYNGTVTVTACDVNSVTYTSSGSVVAGTYDLIVTSDVSSTECGYVKFYTDDGTIFAGLSNTYLKRDYGDTYCKLEWFRHSTETTDYNNAYMRWRGTLKSLILTHNTTYKFTDIEFKVPSTCKLQSDGSAVMDITYSTAGSTKSGLWVAGPCIIDGIRLGIHNTTFAGSGIMYNSEYNTYAQYESYVLSSGGIDSNGYAYGDMTRRPKVSKVSIILADNGISLGSSWNNNGVSNGASAITCIATGKGTSPWGHLFREIHVSGKWDWTISTIADQMYPDSDTTSHYSWINSGNFEDFTVASSKNIIREIHRNTGGKTITSQLGGEIAKTTYTNIWAQAVNDTIGTTYSVTTTAGSYDATFASVSGLAIGHMVATTTTQFIFGSKITNINGTTVTFDQPALVTASGVNTTMTRWRSEVFFYGMSSHNPRLINCTPWDWANTANCNPATGTTYKPYSIGNEGYAINQTTNFSGAQFTDLDSIDGNIDIRGEYVSGTYTMTGTTTVNVNIPNHGKSVGDYVWLKYNTGSGYDGQYTIASVVDANNFTYVAASSSTTNGTVRMLIKANSEIRKQITLGAVNPSVFGQETTLIQNTLPTKGSSKLANSVGKWTYRDIARLVNGRYYIANDSNVTTSLQMRNPNTPAEPGYLDVWEGYDGIKFLRYTPVTQSIPTVINSATYAQSGTTATVTHTAHGYSTGKILSFDTNLDNVVEEMDKYITVVDANTYTYVSSTSVTVTSGTPTRLVLDRYAGGARTGVLFACLGYSLANIESSVFADKEISRTFWKDSSGRYALASRLSTKANLTYGKDVYQNGDDIWISDLSTPREVYRRVGAGYVDENGYLVINESLVEQLFSGTTAQRPAHTFMVVGQPYFDTTLGRNIIWNGSIWINSDELGTPADALTSGTTAQRPATNLKINQRYYDTTLGCSITWNGATWDIGTCKGSLTTTSVTANQVLATFPIATYRSVRMTIQATQGTNYHDTEILVNHDGTTPNHIELASLVIGTDQFTVSTDISSGNVRILLTPATANSTVFKYTATLIEV